MSNIKVCIFCESWESGGIESFLFNVLNNMDLTGLEIDIVVSQIKPSVFLDKLTNLGVNFKELSGSQRKPMKNYVTFVNMLKKRRYDVIHLNIFHAFSFIYGFIARKYGIPNRIAHSHNTALRNSRTKFIKLVIHKICRQLFYSVFTDFWACSTAAAEFLFPKKITAPNKYQIILNGIEAENFTFDSKKRFRFRKKLKISDELLILNIGRLSEQKNQSFLLDIAEVLTKRKTDFIMIFIGNGDKLNELREKADKLKISDKVIFYGRTSEISSVLSASDIFVFPSLFEGLGIAVIEAQAAALPVICSENIPAEAFITDYIYALSLKTGAEKWADMILKTAESIDRNINTVTEIKNKGYDIKSSAMIIEKRYRKCADG